jgi:hypothetical protein
MPSLCIAILALCALLGHPAAGVSLALVLMLAHVILSEFF